MPSATGRRPASDVTELAYKFTLAGARSPFTGFAWPVGEWVEADGEVALCRNGVHACRPEALPRWLNDELWLVELDGVVEERDGVVLARRARLLARIDAWNEETSRELARSCAAVIAQLAAEHPHDDLLQRRARTIPEIADGPDPSATALAMYTTAHAADEVVAGSYWAERRRQAEWLRARLQLDHVAAGVGAPGIEPGTSRV
jgi:hypothetical protein